MADPITEQFLALRRPAATPPPMRAPTSLGSVGASARPRSPLRPDYEMGRDVGRGLRSLIAFPGAAMRSIADAAGGLREAWADEVRPMYAGFADVPQDVDDRLPEPMPTPPPAPGVATTPARFRPSASVGAKTFGPSRFAPSPSLDPALSQYTDPVAVEQLQQAAPEAPAPPPKVVAGHLQPGQMVVSGGMRSFPDKTDYSEAYLASLNPESFDDLMSRRAAVAQVKQAELGARSPRELADVAIAQQDIADEDARTRAPGRQRALLALRQQEYEHPVSEAQRAEARALTYQRYGYPQEVSGAYDLQRQYLTNQGLLDRTRLEQEGLSARDLAETERARLRANADTRSTAMRALGSMEAKQMDPYAPTRYRSQYEPDFYNFAFGFGNEAAPDQKYSPEQIADVIKQRYGPLSPQEYKRRLQAWEASGDLSGLTALDRQRIYSALGIRE